MRKVKNILFVLFILFFIAFIPYYKISKIDTFANAKIVSFSSRRMQTSIKYEFYNKLNTEQYSGVLARDRVRDIDDLNFYLVGYNKKNPKISYLFFSKNQETVFNLDSLNNCCKPSDYINFMDYANGGHFIFF